MAKVIRSYGIHDKLFNAINGRYANTRAKVYTHQRAYLKSLI